MTLFWNKKSIWRQILGLITYIGPTNLEIIKKKKSFLFQKWKLMKRTVTWRLTLYKLYMILMSILTTWNTFTCHKLILFWLIFRIPTTMKRKTRILKLIPGKTVSSKKTLRGCSYMVFEYIEKSQSSFSLCVLNPWALKRNIQQTPTTNNFMPWIEVTVYLYQQINS